MNWRVVETDFATVHEVWRERLWPGRVTAITPISAIRFGGGYDLSLLDREPVFFRLVAAGVTSAGVISGFPTHELHYRCRGLFVSEEFRGLGLSQLLIRAVAKRARKSGCRYLWTMPRRSAWEAYRRFGFELTSDWFEEGVEFGPNAFARADLEQILSIP